MCFRSPCYLQMKIYPIVIENTRLISKSWRSENNLRIHGKSARFKKCYKNMTNDNYHQLKFYFCRQFHIDSFEKLFTHYQ